MKVEEKKKRKNLTCACDACRKSKVRCDGKETCDRCSRRNLLCVYSKQKKRGFAPRKKKKIDDIIEKQSTIALINQQDTTNQSTNTNTNTNITNQEIIPAIRSNERYMVNTEVDELGSVLLNSLVKCTLLENFSSFHNPQQLTTMPSTVFFTPYTTCQRLMQKIAVLYAARSERRYDLVNQLERIVVLNIESLPTTIESVRAMALLTYYYMGKNTMFDQLHERTFSMVDQLERSGARSIDLIKILFFLHQLQPNEYYNRHYYSDLADIQLQQVQNLSDTELNEMYGTSRRLVEGLRKVFGSSLKRVYFAHALSLEQPGGLYTRPARLTYSQYVDITKFTHASREGRRDVNGSGSHAMLFDIHHLCMVAMLEESLFNYDEALSEARSALFLLQKNTDLLSRTTVYIMIAVNCLFKLFVRCRDLENAEHVLAITKLACEHFPFYSYLYETARISLNRVASGEVSADSLFEPSQSLACIVSRYASPLAFSSGLMRHEEVYISNGPTLTISDWADEASAPEVDYDPAHVTSMATSDQFRFYQTDSLCSSLPLSYQAKSSTTTTNAISTTSTSTTPNRRSMQSHVVPTTALFTNYSPTVVDSSQSYSPPPVTCTVGLPTPPPLSSSSLGAISNNGVGRKRRRDDPTSDSDRESPSPYSNHAVSASSSSSDSNYIFNCIINNSSSSSSSSSSSTTSNNDSSHSNIYAYSHSNYSNNCNYYNNLQSVNHNVKSFGNINNNNYHSNSNLNYGTVSTQYSAPVQPHCSSSGSKRYQYENNEPSSRYYQELEQNIGLQLPEISELLNHQF